MDARRQSLTCGSSRSKSQLPKAPMEQVLPFERSEILVLPPFVGPNSSETPRACRPALLRLSAQDTPSLGRRLLPQSMDHHCCASCPVGRLLVPAPIAHPCCGSCPFVPSAVGSSSWVGLSVLEVRPVGTRSFVCSPMCYQPFRESHGGRTTEETQKQPFILI